MTGRATAAELRRILLAAKSGQGGIGQPDVCPTAPPRLTPVQREMWLSEHLGQAGSAYTTLRVWRLRGKIDIAALEQAVADVVRRHDAFAMRIAQEAGGPVPVFDAATALRGIEPELPQGDDPEGWLQARLSTLARQRFALETGPLFGVHLILMGAGDLVLVWTLHHLISDDWSFSRIARDLGEFYRSRQGQSVQPLPALGAGYQGHLASGEAQAEAAPGQRTIDRADPPWPRTGDTREPHGDPGWAETVAASVGADDLARLHAAARGMGVSAYALMAALYQVLLARLCDEAGISIGVSRTVRLSSEDEEKVGMFVDHMEIPGEAGGDLTLGGLAAQVSQTIRDRPRLAFAPAEGRATSATLVYYAGTLSKPELAGIDCELVVPQFCGLSVDLHLGLRPTAAGADLWLSGRVASFTPQLLLRLVRLFGLHLQIVGSTPDPSKLMPFSLPLFLDDADRSALLQRGVTEGAYPDQQDIAARFFAVAAAHPEAPALHSPVQRWSYRELAWQAAGVSDWLGSLGLVPGDVIGLALPRGADMIRATLGALRAGLVIAPLDPEYPALRRGDMADQAGCKIILGDNATAGDALHQALPPLRSGAGGTLPERTDGNPDRPAYIVFTSGSTGRPKGVVTTHRSIQRLAAGLGPRRPGPGDRIALIASPSFDGSFIEIFGALLNGAELVTPEGELGDHQDIAALLRRYRVTKGFLTTGLFNLILDTVPGAFASFDWLATGGEAMSPEHAHRFRLAYPGIDLLNVYGPTENGALTTSHIVDAKDSRLVPIGRPMPGNVTLVLGRDGAPVPAGFAGELWIGGPGLAREYIGLPEQTAAAFQSIPRDRLGLGPDLGPDLGQTLRGSGPVRLYATGDRVVQREDGALCYNGRRDSQIKLSGYRIEPREIEAAIRRIEGVRDVMVIPRRDALNGRVIALDAGIVGAPALWEANGAAIRRHLRQQLPGVMVPSCFCPLEAMPLTPNGKRDARALATLISAALGAVEGIGGLEGIDPVLVEIWTRFVAPPEAGAASDFFLAGGQSLRAMQMLAEVEARFARRIPIATFFETPTLGGLAETVAKATRQEGRRYLVLLREAEAVPSSALPPGQAAERIPMIATLGLHGACIWARSMVEALPLACGAVYGLNLDPADPGAEAVTSLDLLARAMVDEILAEFPDGRVALVGYSFAGFFAFVLAAEMERRGHPPARLIQIDPNTNLLPDRGPAPQPQRDTAARLAKLRLACRLRPITTPVDFIFCARSFPLPRRNDGEEWAVLTSGGLRLYTLQTSHLAVIYGAWAKVLASCVTGILDLSRQPDARLSVGMTPRDISRLYQARDAMGAGDAQAALDLGTALLAGPGRGLTFVEVLVIQAMAGLGDQKALLRRARQEMDAPQPNAALLAELEKHLRRSGEAKLAMKVLWRLFASSGAEVHGAFDLVAGYVSRGQMLRAYWVAGRAARRGRSPIAGLLCHALIARARGQRGKAFDLILAALGRSDTGVPHIAVVLDRILRPQDHVFALRLIEAAETQFKGADALSRLRRDWEAHAAALAGQTGAERGGSAGQ